MANTTKTFHRKPYHTISPTTSVNDQSGRTVLITGANAGIGFAIARAFIQACASRVILTGRSPERLEQAAATLTRSSSVTKIESFVCDLNSESSVENLWQRLKLEDIRLDVLVLNAADTTSGAMVPVKSFLANMRAAFKTNVWTNSSMVAHFLDQETDGRDVTPKAIINISSFMAHSNPAPFQAAYSTSKAAFAHTLQLLADEVPSHDCQIINVHPGAVLTEAAEKNLPQAAKDAVAWDEVELPAAFSVWAATNPASFLHGRFVWANWDVDELLARKADFDDPGFLKLGIQGAEHVDIRTIFEKIKQEPPKV